MTAPKQPILSLVLSRLYDKTFGSLDDEDNKQEKSANNAMVLLSENFRCTNNRYYITKLNEVWASVKAGEDKWTDDLWYPALVKFAYDNGEMGQDDAAKVLKNFLKLWGKKNTGVAKNVNITNIITLKKGLLASEIHLSHVSVYDFLIKACPIVNILPANTPACDIAWIVEKLVSKLPHHISLSPTEDSLFEANNYFILKHYKTCQFELSRNIEQLDSQLDSMERSDRVQESVMRQVTSHHDYDGILKELDVTSSSNWEAMRGLQMQIVRIFVKLCRSKFIARYPTAMLFTDIDEQISKYGIDVSHLNKMLDDPSSGSGSCGADYESDGGFDADSDAGWSEVGSDDGEDQEFESDDEQEQEDEEADSVEDEDQEGSEQEAVEVDGEVENWGTALRASTPVRAQEYRNGSGGDGWGVNLRMSTPSRGHQQGRDDGNGGQDWGAEFRFDE